MPLRKLIANPSAWFVVALTAAGVLAGCGGGSGGVQSTTPATYSGATASPTPSIAPASESTTIPLTTSGGAATLGGISNGTSNFVQSVNVTFPALTIAASGSATVALTAAAPTSEPTPDARALPHRFSLGATVTPLAYLTVTPAQNVSMASSPSFSVAMPYNVSLSFGSNAYVAVYSAGLGTSWSSFSGPATVGASNTLTFASSPLASPLSMQANVAYTFAIVTTGTATLLPSPTPSPVGTGGLSGSQIDHITGLGATFDAAGDMTETESGSQHTYAVVYKPVPQQPWVYTPALNTTYTYFGYPTVEMRLDPTGPSPSPLPSDYTNDKVNLTIGTYPVPSPGAAATSTDDLWEGFDFALDPSTTMPGVDVILAQWWQGTPFSPPVSLILKANTYECYVVVRNDQTGGNPDATAFEFDAGNCAPTNSGGAIQWQQFMFHVRFGNQGDGTVVAWHNNMTTPVATWTGNVGYVPGQCVYINGSSGDGCLGAGATPAPPAAAPTPYNHLDAYFGPYRPSDPHPITMYITNVKFAKDQTSVDPTQP